MNPLIFIVGPTASGKSAVGLALAREFSGGILNCDSLQVYKRLDIGTAKPTEAERSQAPHFLFDFVDPGRVLTAGDFRKEALKVLEKELPSKPLFAVGGSGFYVQALEKGMFDVAKPSEELDRQVRERLKSEGLSALYEELQRKDPDYAEAISPNDSYRIVRALVVIAESGKTMTEVKASFQVQRLPYETLKIGLNPDREVLRERIGERVEAMMRVGFLGEVESLLKDGYESWPPLLSVGYRECVDHIQGRLSKDKLVPTIIDKTWKLAKKQRTWFKRDSEIHWLENGDLMTQARELVVPFLDRVRRKA